MSMSYNAFSIVSVLEGNAILIHMEHMESINGSRPASFEATQRERVTRVEEKICAHMEAELGEIRKEVELIKKLKLTEHITVKRNIEKANEALEKENEILRDMSARLRKLNETLMKEAA